MSEKFLIVGLGNPGAKYSNTRHSVGFAVIDQLVRRYSFGAGRSEKRAQTWDGNIGTRRVKLAKPQTYMNRSGESVRQLADYFDIAYENLIVMHDDLDTPFGTLRLRWNGGHGGQNGLRSIVQHLGTSDFARLRFGIGRPPGRMNPVDYVLQPWRGDDAIRATELAGRAADAIEVWLSDGLERAMTLYNGDAFKVACQESKPDLSEKLALFMRAHELAPGDPKPLTKLIALQKKLGKFDEAVANHLKLAQLYGKREQYTHAIAEKTKAVAIQPGLVEVQREIAEWHLAQANRKKAVSRYLILAQHLREVGEVAAAMEAAEAGPGHQSAASKGAGHKPLVARIECIARVRNSTMQVIAPELVGMSAERLKKIGSKLQQYVDEERVAGFVTLAARDSEVVHSGSLRLPRRRAAAAHGAGHDFSHLQHDQADYVHRLDDAL